MLWANFIYILEQNDNEVFWDMSLSDAEFVKEVINGEKE